MQLDDDDLKRGLRYIVGTWQVDYLVNAFSNDLAHIPATEFKSEDGTDFSVITFEFVEDHTLVMKDTSKAKEVKGTWEQTGWSEFHYTLEGFFDIKDSSFLKNAETLQMMDGNLNFSIGFLAVSLKKISEGTITKEPDIGEIPMSDEDEKAMDIVGKYETVSSFSVVNDTPGMYTKEEVKAELDRKVAAGDMDADDAAQCMMAFDTVIEFCEDHKIKYWMNIPAGVSEEQIKAAIEAGEIADCDGTHFCAQTKEWKSIGGKYYYDTGEQREILGEVKSPWDELVFDEDGLLSIMDGMAKIKRIP